MTKLVRSGDAVRDADRIWLYIAERNFDAADRLLRQIDARLRDHADTPGMGTPRDDLAPGLRSFPVDDYIVFYRAIQGGIELLRIIHGGQDLSAQFRATARK